jgi:hypothetical protein
MLEKVYTQLSSMLYAPYKSIASIYIARFDGHDGSSQLKIGKTNSFASRLSGVASACQFKTTERVHTQFDVKHTYRVEQLILALTGDRKIGYIDACICGREHFDRYHVDELDYLKNAAEILVEFARTEPWERDEVWRQRFDPFYRALKQGHFVNWTHKECYNSVVRNLKSWMDLDIERGATSKVACEEEDGDLRIKTEWSHQIESS